MKISENEYTWLCEQGIPYEGEVEGLGQAYTGISTSVYPANESGSVRFFRTSTVNVCVVTDTVSDRRNPSAAVETKIKADMEQHRRDVAARIEEVQKALSEQAAAHTRVLEANKAATEKARIEKEKADKEEAEKAKAEREKANKKVIQMTNQLLETVKKALADYERESNRWKMFISWEELKNKLSSLTNQTSDTEIKKALEEVAKYIGKTKYGKKGSRTGTSEEALEYMDCSEFACRFLQIACGLEEFPPMSSGSLRDKKDFSSYLKYIKGSDAIDFKDIRPGDIFVWSRSELDGHVGVVESYDPATDRVTILESIGESGSSEFLNGGKQPVSQVRRSIYTRLGGSLYGHEKWLGYYRPVVKTK
jgi:hypothetical protein